jgi:hypothetical protein
VVVLGGAQDAECEAVAAFDLGLCAELAQDGCGHHGVLVVPEQLLYGLHTLDQVAGGRAEGGFGGLGGVAQAFRGFAGLMEFGVAVGALREVLGGADMGVDPPVGAPDQRSPLAPRLTAGGLAEWGFGEQVVDGGPELPADGYPLRFHGPAPSNGP